MVSAEEPCRFCEIASREVPAHIVFEDPQVLVFLDARPVFKGHCLVVPRMHWTTLGEMPDAMLAPLFSITRRVASALELGIEADGSFIALNDRVSQSIPHVHVHVIPRRFKDGLRGFFWPRRPYASDTEKDEYARAIRGALQGDFRSS